MSSKEGFIGVSLKLHSIFVVVSKERPKKAAMQDFSMISTKPRDRNVQVPLTTIDARSTEVKSLLIIFVNLVVRVTA